MLFRSFDLRKQDFRPGNVPVIGATQVIGYHDTANVKGPGVTVVRSGSSAGMSQYIQSDFWAHNVLLYVKDFHGNIPKFVYHKIMSLDLTRFRQGVAVPTLNRNTFSSIDVLVPSCEEQKEIVHILDMIEMREHVAAKHKERHSQGDREEADSCANGATHHVTHDHRAYRTEATGHTESIEEAATIRARRLRTHGLSRWQTNNSPDGGDSSK